MQKFWEGRLEHEFDHPINKRIREYRLKKTAYEILYKSYIGKVSAIVNFIVASGSVFIYWKGFHLNIFSSVLFGMATWLVVTSVSKRVLIKILGIERSLKQVSEKKTQDAIKYF